MVFPSWDESQDFVNKYAVDASSVAEVVARDPGHWSDSGAGWATQRTNPRVVLVPAQARYRLATRTITWDEDGTERVLPFRADHTYLDTTGFRVIMKQVRDDPVQWTIIGTSAQATVCHKPSTVSGGGKSEISKSIADAITIGSPFVADFEADMDAVADIVARDYAHRYAEPSWNGQDTRPVLGLARSMGSIIKLLTPSKEFSAEHNEFIRSIPRTSSSWFM